MKPILFSKHLVLKHSRLFGIKTQTPSLRASLFLSALLLLSNILLAQSNIDLRYLVLDPLPIAINEIAPEDDLSEAIIEVTELGTLPKENAIDLYTWLSTRPLEQQSDPEQVQETILSYQQSIKELELKSGPFSDLLPQQLFALATSLQENGDYDAALEYLNQANHIIRINNGLFSADQIPIIKKIIENQLYRGNLLAADAQQDYLFYVQKKNAGLDTSELLPALNDYAEWNMFAFSANSLLPIVSDYALQIKPTAALRSSPYAANFRIESLINAQTIYSSIIQILLDNFGKQDPRLLDFEMRLALTNYFFETTVMSDANSISNSDIELYPSMTNSNFSTPSISSMGYRYGRDALTRRIDYMLAMEGVDPSALMHAKLDLADWMLFFRRHRNKALEDYEEIYTDFASNFTDEEKVNVFTPAYPKTLPTFLRHFNSRETFGIPIEQALLYKGYVDMEIDLNRYGHTVGFRVLGHSASMPEEIETHLLRNLRRSHFRPRFDSGKLLAADQIHVRYYYTY